MGKFVEYLKYTKKIVGSSCVGRINVVMGNEACDLDSAVCALIFSYHLYSINQNKESLSFVPILNIPREDYNLRTEVKYWLRKHDILEDYLTFRNDLDLAHLLKNDNLEITLVDHNILAACDEYLEPAVVQVLDHHKLERKINSVPKGMVVEKVGSCTTLVTENIKKENKELMDSTIASILRGSILLDTVNLSEEAKIVTPKDIEMVLWLEENHGNEEGRSAVCAGLTGAKADVSALSCGQLLRKDLKVASGMQVRVGVASIPMLVKDFLSRSDTSFENLRDHCHHFKYNILVIMGIYPSKVQREIAMFSEDLCLLDEISSYLASASDKTLKLSSFDSDIKNLKAFMQGNHAATRKVVLPFIKEWLERH